MADPIDQQTSSPQSLVDAALGTNPVVAPLAPLAPLTQNEPVVDPIPTPTPAPAPTSVPMGDDTPLAFAMPSSTPTQTVEPMPNPVLETQQSSYLPPVPPAPTMAPEMPKKKKNKMGLVIGGVVALLLFVFGGIAGYQYISTGEVPLIAGVLDDYKYNTKIEGGTGTVGNKDKNKNNEDERAKNDGAALVAQKAAEKKADETIAANNKSIDTMPYDELKNLRDQIVKQLLTLPEFKILSENSLKSSEAQIAAGEAYNKFLTDNPDVKCTVEYKNGDGSATSSIDTSNTVNPLCKNGWEAAKAAYGAAICGNGYYGVYDKDGKPVCTPNTDTSCGRNLDTGAPVCCTTPCAKTATTDTVCEPPGRLECKTEGATDAEDKWCLIEANSSSCGGSKTSTEDKTTKTTAPTMSCSGLSSVPDVKVTPPSIGTKVTFTCAGAVVPATAGTLSYKFRYSINSGTFTSLPNKVGALTTAELTIAACGTYAVECQACATLNGVVTCDPIWTGATAL